MAWQELETTLPRSSQCRSVATTSWTASKSEKVTRTYTDGRRKVTRSCDHSDSDTGALELTAMNLYMQLDIDCYFFVVLCPDPTPNRRKGSDTHLVLFGAHRIQHDM